VQISYRASKLFEVASSSVFGNVDRNELSVVRHDNPAIPRGRSVCATAHDQPNQRSRSHLQGITWCDDEAVKSHHARMWVASKCANDLHLAPQRTDTSGGRRRLGSVYEFNCDSRVMMLRSDDLASRHSGKMLLGEAVQRMVLSLTRFTDPHGTPVS
jgi:hypothetical protein